MQYRSMHRLGRQAYSVWENVRAMLSGFAVEIDANIPQYVADEDEYTVPFITWVNEIEAVNDELAEMEDMFSNWDAAIQAIKVVNEIVRSNRTPKDKVEQIKDAIEGIEA